MPTAIIGTFARDGFVVASDGLGTKTNPEESPDQDTKKIFSIEYPGRVLVYALMGNPVIVEDVDHSKIVVDIPVEIAEQAKIFHSRQSKNLAGFVTRLCEPVNKLLKAAKANGRIAEFPSAPKFQHEEGETIARLLFMGYFDGKPAQVNVRFFHIDQSLQEPWILTKDHREDFQYGSDKVAALVMADDPHFKKYKVQARKTHLENSIEIAKNFIDAWGDPEAVKVDPANCRTIGGQTQVYTVTPQTIQRVWPV